MQTTETLIKTTAVIDLEAVLRYLKSNLADEIYTGKDAYKAHMNNKAYRRLLTTYLVNNLQEIREDDVMGLHAVVDLKYHNDVLGAALIKIGAITGARVYAGDADPFGSLPGTLNDLVVGKFTKNLDDSKAQARCMQYLAVNGSRAAVVLDKFLRDPDAILSDVGHHFDVDTKVAKQLITALGMDGSIKSWRSTHRIPEDIADHRFVLEYAAGVRELTESLAQTIPQNLKEQVVALIVEHRREKGKLPFDNWKVTWKSYKVQEVEFMSLKAKMAKCPHGFCSLEHDGIRVYAFRTLMDGTAVVPPSTAALEQRMTEAVSKKLGAHTPVVCKPVREIDYEGQRDGGTRIDEDQFETKMCIPFSRIPEGGHLQSLKTKKEDLEKKIELLEKITNKTREEKDSLLLFSCQLEILEKEIEAEETRRQKNYEWLYLEIFNHYFVNLTFMKQPVIAQVAYYPGSNRMSKNILTTASELEGKFRIEHTSKKKRMVTWWLGHEKRRECHKLGFYPNKELASDNPRDFNTFAGLPFDYLPRPAAGLDWSLLGPFLSFWFEVLAIGSAAHFEYQIKWIAFIIQQRKKTGVVLHLYGDQGAGKDMLLGDWGMMGRMLGSSFRKVSKGSNVQQKFNADMMGVLYVVLDEVEQSKQWQNDAFKDFITGKVMRIEPKGIDVFYTEDFRSFGSTSNNRNAYQVEPGDRRFYMVEVEEKYAMKKVRSGEMTAEQRQRELSHIVGARYGADEPARDATTGEIDAVAKQLFWFLQDVDLTSFDLRAIPASEHREERIQAFEAENVDPVRVFLEDVCADPDYDPYCTSGSFASALFRLFRAFCRSRNIEDNNMACERFGRDLKKHPEFVRIVGKRNNKTLYQLISHECEDESEEENAACEDASTPPSGEGTSAVDLALSFCRQNENDGNSPRAKRHRGGAGVASPLHDEESSDEEELVRAHYAKQQRAVAMDDLEDEDSDEEEIVRAVAMDDSEDEAETAAEEEEEEPPPPPRELPKFACQRCSAPTAEIYCKTCYSRSYC